MPQVDPMSKKRMNFDSAPFLVLWELTRACALACKHCRARAISCRNPDELKERDLLLVFEQLEELGSPLLILTGGDPFERPDLLDIVKEARSRNFRVAVTPSATARVTQKAIFELAGAGIERLAISVDGADASSHDLFRGVSGSYEQTLRIIEWAREANIPIQINTSISKSNIASFDAIKDNLEKWKIALWSVFFLVPIGRASEEMQISALESECILRKMVRLALHSEFDIKSTAAPHFRRVLIQTLFNAKQTDQDGLEGISPQMRLGALRSYQSVNDGKGILFISHTGDVYPSGFLPVSAGNLKETALAEIYRHSPLFQNLRKPDLLQGKCGRCRYKAICGGSRARAFAETGDFLAQDSLCVYDEALQSETQVSA